MIDKGQVKLADFGASKRLDEEVMNQGIQGVTGTLMYMAPEVLQSADGGGKFDHQRERMIQTQPSNAICVCFDQCTGDGRRADIWSLGITLIELAYGKHPFESLEDALIRVCETQEPLPNFPNFFTKDAQDFLGLCLIRDPKTRYVGRKRR